MTESNNIVSSIKFNGLGGILGEIQVTCEYFNDGHIDIYGCTYIDHLFYHGDDYNLKGTSVVNNK